MEKTIVEELEWNIEDYRRIRDTASRHADQIVTNHCNVVLRMFEQLLAVAVQDPKNELIDAALKLADNLQRPQESFREERKKFLRAVGEYKVKLEI